MTTHQAAHVAVLEEWRKERADEYALTGLTTELARLRDEALTAAIAAMKQSGWQPIETAPKDGETPMLFWDAQFPECAPFIGYRGADFPDDAACDANSIACYPTHWMPLPAAAISHQALADKYGIAKRTVGRILSGKSYLPAPPASPEQTP